MTTSIRTFLAVDPAPDTHTALVDLKRDLAATGADVKWVRDDNLHCTVKFLGGVEPGRLETLRASLQPIAASHRCFPAIARGLGVFPSPSRPRVLWVGFTAEPLAPLVRDLEAALASLGFAREARPFSGHITLGRVNGGRGWNRIEVQMRIRGNEIFGETLVREIVAYRSQLQRGGSVYTPLWTIRLGETTLASR